MGIQLGLTDSLRCNVSETEGKGIGYWKVTVYALGYQDYSTTFQITADNLPKVYGPVTEDQKTQLIKLAAKAKKYLDDSKTVYPEGPDGVTQKTLQDHYVEATEMITDTSKKENDAAELITELTGYLAKMDAANASTKPTTQMVTSDAIAVGSYGYTVTATITAKDGTIADVSWAHSENTSMANWINLFDNGKAEFFKKFIGLTSENAVSTMDGLKLTPDDNSNNTDAVSGATVTSAAVRDAIKNAYQKLN